MSIHIDRKCMYCGKVNDNEIYVNWMEEEDFETPEEWEEQKEVIRKFYDEWVCYECKTTQ